MDTNQRKMKKNRVRSKHSLPSLETSFENASVQSTAKRLKISSKDTTAGIGKSKVTSSLPQEDSTVDDEIEVLGEEIEFVDLATPPSSPPPLPSPFGFSEEFFEESGTPTEKKAKAKNPIKPSEEKEEDIPVFKEFSPGISYRKLNSTTLLLAILEGMELYFSGKCFLKVLKGKIGVCGYEWSSSDREKRLVLSSRGFSQLSIQGLAGEEDTDAMEVELELNPDPEIPSLVSQEELMTIHGSVFLMEGFENSWIRGMRKYCLDGETLVGSEITGITTKKLPPRKMFGKSFGFLFSTPKQMLENRLLVEHETWGTLLDMVRDSNSEFAGTKLAIFGGKGAGKSTFARWMTNKILSTSNWSSVIYIDLDPGQAEFTLPGVVSVVYVKEPVLGPNFSHLQQPLLSIFLGTTNVVDCPEAYVLAVTQIKEFLMNSAEFRDMPWVINTMGFVRGIGADLGMEVIHLFQPTHVVQIQTSNARRNFEFELDHAVVGRYASSIGNSTTDLPEYFFFEIESACDSTSTDADHHSANQWGAKPGDLRNNVIISYFADLIGKSDDNTLNSVIPYNISLSNVTLGVLPTSEPLQKKGLLRIINGSLVALCYQPRHSDLDQDSKGIETFTNYQNCLGFGLVRSIDEEEGILHVITPVPAEVLEEKVNFVIGAGKIGIPEQLYSIDAKEGDGREIPYLMNNRKSGSQLHKATSTNFVPKRMRHSVLQNSFTF